jgi:hypothetical protein
LGIVALKNLKNLFGEWQEILDVRVEDIRLILAKHVLEVGGHFFHFQFQIKSNNLLINVHDSNGNVGGNGVPVFIVGVDEFGGHEIEDFDDLVDGVTFEGEHDGHGVEEFDGPLVGHDFVVDLVFVVVQLLLGEGGLEVLCEGQEIGDEQGFGSVGLLSLEQQLVIHPGGQIALIKLGPAMLTVDTKHKVNHTEGFGPVNART